MLSLLVFKLDSKMEMLDGNVVLPGDTFDAAIDENIDSLHLGPGLTYNDNQIVAVKAGIIRYRSPKTFWIDTSQKRVINQTNLLYAIVYIF